MRFVAKAAAAAALICCAAPEQALAQGPQEMRLPAKAQFKHRHSKVALPPVLAGLPRSRAAEYEADQLDIFSEYATADAGEAYTVYIYRHVAGSLPVWFDRARSMIERRDALGTATFHSAGAFVPPGRSNSAGLLATYALAGKGYRSTGVALVPVGEWLIKLRVSSESLSPAELGARMNAALAEIEWPAKMAPAPAAAPVEPCATALSLSGDAKPAPKDDNSTAEALMGALVGMAAAHPDPKREAAPREPRWCRDSTELADGGVYRADERKDGYFIAVADAGRGISAGPSAGGAALEAAGEKKAGTASFEVQMILLAQTLASGPLDRLPPPAQALAIAKEGRFATSFGTWGKGKGQLTIGEAAIK